MHILVIAPEWQAIRLQWLLDRLGCAAAHVRSLDDARAWVAESTTDVVLIPVPFDDAHRLELRAQWQQVSDIPMIHGQYYPNEGERLRAIVQNLLPHADSDIAARINDYLAGEYDIALPPQEPFWSERRLDAYLDC